MQLITGQSDMTIRELAATVGNICEDLGADTQLNCDLY